MGHGAKGWKNRIDNVDIVISYGWGWTVKGGDSDGDGTGDGSHLMGGRGSSAAFSVTHGVQERAAHWIGIKESRGRGNSFDLSQQTVFKKSTDPKQRQAVEIDEWRKNLPLFRAQCIVLVRVELGSHASELMLNLTQKRRTQACPRFIGFEVPRQITPLPGTQIVPTEPCDPFSNMSDGNFRIWSYLWRRHRRSANSTLALPTLNLADPKERKKKERGEPHNLYSTRRAWGGAQFCANKSGESSWKTTSARRGGGPSWMSEAESPRLIGSRVSIQQASERGWTAYFRLEGPK
ncbi:unnamed protein product [Caenorhabditis auriculariae]|uniref:Uncharacterized protein n=1 Tax=Caenorhabditis auriculariae TaxID=2777116 RepID=A0A8S1HKC2_9PELO|nr:unnamed protein product [Caenorhabditis auriculariae]